MNTNHNNPYIGPRTFRRDESHLFYGRDREARDLLSLVISEQLVLFYAQSGAGKSSLINTRLIPNLEGKGFEILRVGRVSGEDHEGIEATNIYIFNLLRSLMQQDSSAEILSKLTLDQFLAALKKDETGYFYDETSSAEDENVPKQRRALIIDQFEEIFTTHPEAWEKREDFFVQIAQAMENHPHLWVVLVMREDYIAYLDPYAHLLPNGLRVRYYMQRLGRESAIKAMKNPVEKIRPYEVGVAEKLVENLSSIKVLRPDGKQEVQAGQYVEPVQLQVVCYSLWENLPAEGEKIREQDLLEVGDVDQSLERYYEGRVAAVAEQKQVSERLIREWFENDLITASGTRNIVLQNQNSDGLRDDVIQTLLGDLVRAEVRSGQVWYELSHDRLIEPVRKNNRIWFEQNLTLFQRQAGLWIQQGRSEGLLLRDAELQKAEEEVQGLELTGDEQAYLKECRALRGREQRDTNQRRMIFAALIASIVLLVVAGFFWRQAGISATMAGNSASTAQAVSTVAVSNAATAQVARQEAQSQKAQAEAESRRALAGQLALESKSVLDQYPQRAQLLGLEALKVNLDAGESPSPIAEEALRAANERVTGIGLPGFTREVSYLQFTRDNQWLLAGSEYSGEFRAWNLKEMDQPGYKPFELNFNTHDEYSVNAYLSDQEKWFIVTLGGAETRLFSMSALKSGMEPLVFQHPVVFLDESRALLEPEESQTVLWRFNDKDMKQRSSSILEGKFEAASTDGKIVTTSISVEDTVRINFWKVDLDHASLPQIINGIEFARGDNETLFVVSASHWLAVGKAFSNRTALSLFDLNNPEESPQVINLPASNSYYSLQSSPQGSWFQLNLSPNDCVCSTVESFFINLENGVPKVSKLRETNSYYNDFLLDGWYVIAAVGYEGDTLYAYYYFINLRREDFASDLSYRFIASEQNPTKWKRVTDPSGNWLSFGNNDAINADVLVADGKLVARTLTSSDSKDNPNNSDPWQSITRIGFEDNVVMSTTSPDKQWHAEGAYGGSLRLWNLQEESKYQVRQFAVEERGPYGLHISSDGQWLVAGSGLWHLEEGLPSGPPIRFSSSDIYQAVFSPDAHWLMYSIDGIKLINLDDFSKSSWGGPLDINIDEIHPYYVSFSPDSRWLVASGGKGATGLWDLANPGPSPSLVLPEEKLREVAFTSDGKYIVGVRDARGPNVFQPNPEPGSSVIFVWEYFPSEEPHIKEVGHISIDNPSQISQDGYLLLSENNQIWDLRCVIQGNPCDPIQLAVPEGASIWFDPDLPYLIASSQSDERTYTYRVWELEKISGPDPVAPNFVYDFKTRYGRPFDFSEIIQPITGTIYLFGGGGGGGGGEPGSYKVDYGIEVLKPSPAFTAFHSLVLRGHEEQVTRELISRSGRWGITISDDSIKLWDLEALEADPFAPAVNLPIETSQINDYGFTMNERFLVILLDNNKLEFLPLHVDELMAQACRSVGRNFIINEWQRYFQSADYRRTCENLPEHPSVLVESSTAP